MVDNARSAEDSTDGIRLNGTWFGRPVDEVFRCAVAPVHVLPHRAVGVPLVVEMPCAILIEHTIGVIHPSVSRCMVISGAELFAVGGVEGVAELHLAPAYEVLEIACGAAVSVEEDVEEHRSVLTDTQLLDVERDIIVHLVDGQSDVEGFHLLVVDDDANVSVLFFLLHGQQQEVAVGLCTPKCMPFAEHLWRLSFGCDGKCDGSHEHDCFFQNHSFWFFSNSACKDSIFRAYIYNKNVAIAIKYATLQHFC